MTVFAEAYDVVDDVQILVQDRIAQAVSFSQMLTGSAMATLSAPETPEAKTRSSRSKRTVATPPIA